MTKAKPNAARGVSVTLVRAIASPAATVFRAWTDPRLLAKWLAPGSAIVSSVTTDAREGGRYRVDGQHADGTPYVISGTYFAIDAPGHIEMSWCYEGPVNDLKGLGSVVIVDFVSLDAKSTELTLTHERNADRAAAEGNRINWSLCLDKLDTVVEGPGSVQRAGEHRRFGFYSEGQRAFQNRFASRRLADRLESALVHDRLKAADAAFITRQNMFFLATADAYGQPSCSYKGGAKGFVTVIDDHCLAYPDYDGNGMHISNGNIDETMKVGLLFVDFEQQARLRVLGKARVSQTDRLLERYPNARLIVRVDVEAVFSNCPRYVHRMKLLQESVYVPDDQGASPVPDWKRLQGVADVLADEDKAESGRETDLNKALNRDS